MAVVGARVRDGANMVRVRVRVNVRVRVRVSRRLKDVVSALR